MNKILFFLSAILCFLSSCDKIETRYYLVTSTPPGIDEIQREYPPLNEEMNMKDFINSISYRVSKDLGNRFFIVETTPLYRGEVKDPEVNKMLAEAKQKADESFLNVDYTLFEITAKKSQLDYFEKGIKEIENGKIPKKEISERFKEKPLKLNYYPIPINDLVVINTLDSLINKKKEIDQELEDYINS